MTTTNNMHFQVKNGLNVGKNLSITGSLVANTLIASSITANSSNAWIAPMTLTRSGDAFGSGSFNGSSATTISMSLATTIPTLGSATATYSNIVVNSKGLITSGNYSNVPGKDSTGIVKASLVNLSSSGYLPLSSATVTNSYFAVSYPALSSLCPPLFLSSCSITQQVLPASLSWSSIIYNGNIFCALSGFNTNSNISAISSDGINWTLQTMPVSTQWQSVAWNGSIFCAISGSSVLSTFSAISSDGINWTLTALPTSASWYFITNKGSLFCAITGNPNYTSLCATSYDGISWSLNTFPVSVQWNTVGSNGSIFVALAGNPTNYAATSVDGVNWTERTMPTSQGWNAVAWNGSIFCALSYISNVAATSPDGINWTPQTMPAVTYWSGISWNGSVFFAYSGQFHNVSIAATSPDGINWTLRTMPASLEWYAVANNGSLFVVIVNSSNVSATISINNMFTTPTYTGTLGIANASWYIKT